MSRLTERGKREFGTPIIWLRFGEETDAATGFTEIDEAYKGIEKLARYEDIADEPEKIIAKDDLDKVIDYLDDEQCKVQCWLTMDGGTEYDHIYNICDTAKGLLYELKGGKHE